MTKRNFFPSGSPTRIALFYAGIVGGYLMLTVGCAAILSGPEAPDGCRETAASYPTDKPVDVECHALTTTVIVESEGWTLHMCKCPSSRQTVPSAAVTRLTLPSVLP